MKSAQHHIERLKKKYLKQRCLEISLWSLAVGVFTICIVRLTTKEFQLLLGAIAFSISWIGLFLSFRLNKISERNLLNHINMRYPEFEESADLLSRNYTDLTSLERIQQLKSMERLDALFPSIKLPHGIEKAAVTVLICCAVLLGSTALNQHQRSNLNNSHSAKDDSPSVSGDSPPALEQHQITVTPPLYLGRKPFRTENFKLQVAEGSKVEWRLRFSEEISTAKLVFGGKDSVMLNETIGEYVGVKALTASTIYQIIWSDLQMNKRTSDYFQIDVTEDKSPEISFIDLRQSIELTVSDKTTIEVSAKISDDYQLSAAHIIATVAKGSGESVKFREEKLLFTRPDIIKGKSVVASRTIDVKKLGLEPGDELYFYAEATDNKKPLANRARTETYFITLQDTASQEMTVDAGLGVDLMPEYFRSQRQIIIDTEKLLRNKKSITQAEFNLLSNELGYDQKVLRLKYGEFLGEEFESELTSSNDDVEEQVETVVKDAEGHEENMAEKFGHAHDSDNEHNLVEDKTHQHADGDDEDPEAKENPLEAFVHAHDDAEEATFFLQSVRAKLKAALTEMWDAELYLRLYQPEKSLPYQYKALKLLKEVSNDSRIYVHKTGFDPPPIKEEKRLTADLTDIKDSKRNDSLLKPEVLPAVRDVVQLIEGKLSAESITLTASDNALLVKAGRELTPIALAKPGQFLSGLSLIKQLQAEDIKQESLRAMLQHLQQILYSALPRESRTSPDAQNASMQLEASFIQNLQKLKND